MSITSESNLPPTKFIKERDEKGMLTKDSRSTFPFRLASEKGALCTTIIFHSPTLILLSKTLVFFIYASVSSSINIKKGMFFLAASLMLLGCCMTS